LYMYILIVAGAVTVLYVFFGDIADGGDAVPFLNPAVILAFFTLAAAAGFLLETATGIGSLAIIGISAAIAVLLDVLLYFFVLLPMSSAEASIAYTDEALLGQVARVIIPIPVDGYGEVVLETYAGMIAKRAAGFDNEAIGQDQHVLVIDVRDNTLYVRAYEPVSF
jgi:membrane protein implicated in regulation of membrane protease activity